MIKKRSRPQPRVREPSPEATEQTAQSDGDEDAQAPISDLIELRKLRKARQGIDVNKLRGGDEKRKRRRVEEQVDQGGLKAGAKADDEDEDVAKEASTRRAVRTNNFTQQTNTLDVDKHMMQYIEENLTVRGRPKEEEATKPLDPQDELYRISDRWKLNKKDGEEGSVTNSLSMLTAIPEVDLGIDTRLKNIEDTEKAKRLVAEGSNHDRNRANPDEEHLVANRFYRPNLKHKSDADILRDAKLEAMGLPPQADESRKQDKIQSATDELVMERFKKRMRK